MTKIVGIVNVTPDSFSDGGEYLRPENAHTKIHELFAQGADMIDIGAESTRPGAQEVSADQEWSRLEPLLNRLKNEYSPDLFMLDTRHAQIAKLAIGMWSNELTINDVTGLSDPAMVTLAAEHNLSVVVGHLPKHANGDIAQAHKHKIGSLQQVVNDITSRTNELIKHEVDARNIIVDPGIGFGKSANLNRKLITCSNKFVQPVMIGYSRKRFIGEHRLVPAVNVALGKLAAANGADYLRVHDVAEHANALKHS